MGKYAVDSDAGVVTYMMNSQLGEFNGIAKCHPGDEFNESLGCEIARTKAHIKYKRTALKQALNYLQYIRFIASQEQAVSELVGEMTADLNDKYDYLANLSDAQLTAEDVDISTL